MSKPTHASPKQVPDPNPVDETDGVSRSGQQPFDAIVALGSNLGDKAANIDRAVALMTGNGDVRLVARSRNYATPPWGKTDQDWFVNAAMWSIPSCRPTRYSPAARTSSVKWAAW